MNELIATYTSLPNLHPALVHFPVALLPIALLLDAFWFRLSTQREWLDRAACVLYLGAALGAGAAYWAGRQAAEALPRLAFHSQLHVNEHSDSALAALWLLVVLAAARIAVSFRDTKGRRKVLRGVLVLIALAGVAVLYRTADLGGGLVYQHGIGVVEGDDHGAVDATDPDQAAEQPAASSPVRTDVASRVVEGESGGLTWVPSPVDRDALGSILQLAPESEPGAVSWVEPTNGMGLAVDGEALLLLPGVFGDVEVRAELDLEGFEGEVGLAHHVLSSTRASLLTVSFPKHEVTLLTRDGDETRRLAQASTTVPDGPFQLMVSAAGRHYYGFLGEERVVHGHEPPLREGGVGLFLSGKGRVRILSMTLTPGGG
ncbi:MAG: DUF2231 domain-containing protein [Thermoanaerobaculia bacterium]